MTRIAQRGRQIFARPLASGLARSEVGIDHRNRKKPDTEDVRERGGRRKVSTVDEQAAWALHRARHVVSSSQCCAMHSIDFVSIGSAPCDGRPSQRAERSGRSVAVWCATRILQQALSGRAVRPDGWSHTLLSRQACCRRKLFFLSLFPFFFCLCLSRQKLRRQFRPRSSVLDASQRMALTSKMLSVLISFSSVFSLSFGVWGLCALLSGSLAPQKPANPIHPLHSINASFVAPVPPTPPSPPVPCVDDATWCVHAFLSSFPPLYSLLFYPTF